MKNIIALCVALMAISVPVFAAEKMTIAIMDFQAQDVPRADALKISELIRNEMVNSGRYLVLERAQVGKILKEQGFQMTGCTDITCAVQVGKLLSARKILVGTVMKFGENVAVTGRVVDVEKGVAEFAEKDRALSKDDLFYMVERFCDKLTLRITGKPLYKKEEFPATYSYSGSSQKYKGVDDPTAWIALSSGIASLTCFGVGYGYYQKEIDKLKKRYNESVIMFFMNISKSYADEIRGFYLIESIKYYRKAKKYIPAMGDTRENLYIASGATAGFAVVMLASFVGRYVYNTYAVNDAASTNRIAVFIPDQYVNPIDWINGKPGFGLGLSMRF